MDRFWDYFVDCLVAIFMPLVCSYHAVCSNVFINVSAEEATELEALGNAFLTPVQYIFAGQVARQDEEGNWIFTQKFSYESGFWFKTATSIVALPPSILLGTAVKGLSFLDEKTRNRHFSISRARASTDVQLNDQMYQEMGLIIQKSTEKLIAQGHLRKEGDENHLYEDKEALADIAKVLNEADIAWWVDCGTCLGAFRYGGVIPWDEDIDIAILQPDSQNVRRVLSKLDINKYMVQDWSSRDHPNSWYKIYIRSTQTTIDVYHFKILPETRELAFIFSYDQHLFFPEWWKIRERRFKVPVSFDIVFPLKTANFDGVEVFVPNDTEKYLQRYYGKNLDPVKVYDPKTGLYEKDLSHPYWKRAHVH